MPLVRLIKDWDWPNLLRQTPRSAGIWDDITFTLDDVQECDFAVVLNRVPADTQVRCPPENVWAIMQEPPIPFHRPMHKGSRSFHRVYTQDTALRPPRFRHSHGALPWHVNKTYDELTSAPVPEKSRPLSWVTSNLAFHQGQQQRMAFLRALSGRVEFDLWGRGFRPIADKWDGLAYYRYSLAIESHSGPYYWTEKLADCFLSWTMPIYYGCTNIDTFFPEESMVRIDIGSPNAIAIIEEIVRSDLWLRNREAIAYARHLVLEKYQLFPFICEQIQASSNGGDLPGKALAPNPVHLRATKPSQVPLLHRVARCVSSRLMRRHQ